MIIIQSHQSVTNILNQSKLTYILSGSHDKSNLLYINKVISSSSRTLFRLSFQDKVLLSKKTMPLFQSVTHKTFPSCTSIISVEKPSNKIMSPYLRLQLLSIFIIYKYSLFAETIAKSSSAVITTFNLNPDNCSQSISVILETLDISTDLIMS